MSEARAFVEHAESIISGQQFFTMTSATDLAQSLNRARTLSKNTDPECYAQACTLLAQVYARTSTGDASRNIEKAISLLKEAEEFFTYHEWPDQWALIQTNRAVAMLDREAGDHGDNISESVRLCRAALQVRSKKRVPLDWAYSMVNLARALCHHSYGPRDLPEAEAAFSETFTAYGRAADEFFAQGRRSEGATCKTNRAAAAKEIVELRLEARKQQAAKWHLDQGLSFPGFLNVSGIDEQENISRAVQIAELIRINPGVIEAFVPPQWVHEVCDSSLKRQDRQTLATARRDATQAINSSPSDPIAIAQAKRVLSKIALLESDDDDEQIELLTSSLENLRGFDVPRDILDVSGRLGEAYAAKGEWMQAAEAYSTSMGALDRLYTQRGTEEGRDFELGRQSKLSEWTAYSLAKSGQLEEAVLALENGRTRALGHRLHREDADLVALEEQSPELASRISSLQQQLRAHRHGDAIDSATSNYQQLAANLDQLIRETRALPEMEGFMRATQLRDIVAAADTSCPLLYLVATAAGSIALIVDGEGLDEGAAARLVTESDLSSAEIVRLLIRYQQAGPSGLLFPRDDELNLILRHLQATLGRAYGSPIKRALDDLGATSVAIIATGILSAFPFAAVDILSPGPAASTVDGRYLGDYFGVLSSPSASVLLSCRRRAVENDGSWHRLVAVGDPTSNRRLEGAAAEVKAISEMAMWAHVELLTGDAATRDSVVAAAGQADYLHIACHGLSDLTDPLKSGLVLADGELSVEEIVERAAVGCRLVVASACDSGRIGIWQVANEHVGLPGAFLAAGAACVVASLWPVDDQATSLLIARFYEELAVSGSSGAGLQAGAPASALRNSQRWLRELTEVELERYLKHHPALRSQQESVSGRGAPDWRIFSRQRHVRPFEDARYWAPFIVVGV